MAKDFEASVEHVSQEELVEKYQQHFGKNMALKLLVKLRKATRDKPKVVAGAAGAIVNSLGSLISALDNPATPTKMKALIIGAVGYILLPLDLIPDMMPVAGYTDDLASAAGVGGSRGRIQQLLLGGAGQVHRQLGKITVSALAPPAPAPLDFRLEPL